MCVAQAQVRGVTRLGMDSFFCVPVPDIAPVVIAPPVRAGLIESGGGEGGAHGERR